MNSTDLIADVALLPSGAQFRRCALQVNPYHYGKTYRGQASTGDAEKHAAAIVDKAVELGVSVLAITDHNHVGSVPTFRAAASGRGVVVFPGFELSSSEGVHILCIYPLDTTQDQLSRYLGKFGITKTSPSTDLADCTFTDALELVREQGGISIAAHATNDKGLLTVLSGKSCIRAWRCEDLLAVQIPGTIEDLPTKYRRIIQNTNPQYQRDNPAADDQAVAVINARDVVTARDLETASASCWIKMSAPSIEGLRQSFLDPGSRVRLSQPGPADHGEVVAISWEGGFLDGAAIHFNPNLNVLVGGRGEGKSTIIESLRYVLDLEPVGEDANRAHTGIVQHVLRSGTKISLLVRTHRPAVSEYRIDRTVPNPPLVFDNEGEVTKLVPRDVLPAVEIYGQHEISELTKSSDKLTRLLDRFVDLDDSLPDRGAEILQGLKSSRQKLLDADSQLRQTRTKLEELPQLEERLARFKEVGVEERLEDQTQLVREERIFTELPGRLTGVRACLATLKEAASADEPLISAEVLDELPGKEILAPLNEAYARFLADLSKVATDLGAALARFDEGVAKVREDWDVRKKEVADEYESILRELQGTKVDGEEFMRLNRRIETLKPLRGTARELNTTKQREAKKRRKQLAEWEDFKAENFRRLDRATKEVNRKLRNRVQVEVSSAGNREALFALLREKVGGRLNETIEALRSQPDLSLTEFVAACRKGADALQETYGITPTQAERLADVGFEILLSIEELELPPTTTISLNTAAEGDPPSWQKLEDLSTGQKATAVLLLLLLDSDSPLIVDQPEDDLDNRFITDGIVPRMREEKQRRQFIFSTHNANIPVLGDAELIVGLSADGEAGSGDGRARIASEHCGSIDSLTVRELVEEILEGGKEAFERRRRKYGF